MLKLKANNNYLIISDNIRISISTVNSMLVRSQGSNSLNFAISAINAKYLEAPHSSSQKRVKYFDAELSYPGLKKQVKLKYDTLSKEQYACRLNLDESAFYELYGKNNIRDLSLGGARDYSTYPGNPSFFQKTSDESDFVICKLKNEKFMDGTMHEVDYKANNGFQNNPDFVPFFDTKTPRTPFVYLCYILEEIFHENGFTVTYNFLREDILLKKIVLYSNQSSYDDTEDFYLAKHLPDITITDFINAVSDLLNVHPIIDETKKEVRLISLEQKLKGTKIIDISEYAANDLVKTSEDLTEKIIFKIAVETDDENQSPHKYLDEQLNLNIKDPVNTFAELPADEASAIRLVSDYNKMYYRRNVATDGTYSWDKYSVNIQSTTFGEGDKTMKIESAFSAIQLDAIYEKQDLNTILIKGNTPFRNEPKKIPLMLGFAHSQEAAFGIYNNSGGTENQLYLTPESLFNYCFKYTANMWVNSYQPFECTLMLSPSMLNTLDYSNLFKIGSTIYLLEEIAYNLEAEKITYEKSKLRAI